MDTGLGPKASGKLSKTLASSGRRFINIRYISRYSGSGISISQGPLISGTFLFLKYT